VLPIWIRMDSHQIDRLDPDLDPHQIYKLDPDPHQMDTLDPDPHQFADKLKFMEYEHFFKV
jgi:hypothetical protein